MIRSLFALGTVHVPKASELVAAGLRRQIVRGQLKEGDALPIESELMAQYEVSRQTLREAFRILEAQGLIRVHRGMYGGARVHVPDADVAARFMGFVLQHRGVTVADVLEARALIEPSVAVILARRADTADIAELTASIDAAAGLPRMDDHLPAHIDFHELMAEIAGNHSLAMLIGLLHRLIDAAWRENRSDMPTESQRLEEEETTIGAHRRLIGYIEARDADGAEALWRDHIRDSNAVLLDSFGPVKLLDLGT